MNIQNCQSCSHIKSIIIENNCNVFVFVKSKQESSKNLISLISYQGN